MARTRTSARTNGTSDPIDALAVTRTVLREPDLPVASYDEVSREFKLLVARREDVVSYRIAVINRLLWRMHELEPSQAPRPASLDQAKTQERSVTGSPRSPDWWRSCPARRARRHRRSHRTDQGHG
jgi:transposase